MPQPAVGPLRPSSIAPAVRAWIPGGQAARLLHLFQRSCNLIDEQGRILSLVSEEIGNGPFNAVVPGIEAALQDLADHTSAVSLDAGRLCIGRLAVDLRFAPVWKPRPDWTALHRARELICQQLLKWVVPTMPPTRGSESGPWRRGDGWQEQFNQMALNASRDLSAALNCADRNQVIGAAKRLAGLGEGLTPLGDDILMGAGHAAWILHAPRHARDLTGAIVEAASSRTTSLSLAWLRAAARGEASIQWHRFLDSLLRGDPGALERSASAILATGHTSGRAAMEGFVAVLLPGLCEGPAIEASAALVTDSLAGQVARVLHLH